MGGTVTLPIEVRRRFFMGKDIPVVVLMVTLQVIAGAAT